MPDGLARRLARFGAKAVAGGLSVGTGGNLSARLPGADELVVTARGAALDELTPADLSVVGIADGRLRGGNPAPSSELSLHLHSYRVRPDVNAVVHLHPQLSVLLTELGHPVRLITTDHRHYVRHVRTLPPLASGSAALAEAGAAELVQGCDCLLLAQHGCWVVADSIELAHQRVANLEQAATATYHALLLGDQRSRAP